MIYLRKSGEPQKSRGILYVRIYDAYHYSLENGDYQYILSRSYWYEDEFGYTPHNS